jgi:hypothetical protein
LEIGSTVKKPLDAKPNPSIAGLVEPVCAIVKLASTPPVQAASNEEIGVINKSGVQADLKKGGALC